MTILGAFLSTWDDARAAFGSGTPVGGSEFDMSAQFHELRSTVLSAVPRGEWTGTAAEAYDGRNRDHAGIIGRLAELDRRLGTEVDRSAAVVTAGRRDLDAVKQWVVDAAASVPPTAAGDRALLPVVAKGTAEIAEIINRSNADMDAIAARIRTIGSGYDNLTGRDGRDTDDPDGKPEDPPPGTPPGDTIPPAPPWTKHDGGAGDWASSVATYDGVPR
ncbi:EspA/EspE family type VII secretion system effector [Mycolicibacterium sp. HS_4_1]